MQMFMPLFQQLNATAPTMYKADSKTPYHEAVTLAAYIVLSHTWSNIDRRTCQRLGTLEKGCRGRQQSRSTPQASGVSTIILVPSVWSTSTKLSLP